MIDVTSPVNPLKKQIPLFLTPEMDLSHFSQVAKVWLSSHNIGEVAVIQNFLDDMPAKHQ